MKTGETDTESFANATLVNIHIREGSTGMFFATCQDEPTFFISAVSLSKLWYAIPSALEHMFSTKYNRDMKAFPTNAGNYANRPFAMVPKELVAKKAAERGPALEATPA